MSTRKFKTPATSSGDLTSTGMPWSEVPDSPCPYTEWLDGRHGPANDTLPSVHEFPIPEEDFKLLPFCTLTVHADQSQWPMFMAHGNDWLIAALELG